MLYFHRPCPFIQGEIALCYAPREKILLERKLNDSARTVRSPPLATGCLDDTNVKRDVIAQNCAQECSHISRHDGAPSTRARVRTR